LYIEIPDRIDRDALQSVCDEECESAKRDQNQGDFCNEAKAIWGEDTEIGEENGYFRNVFSDNVKEPGGVVELSEDGVVFWGDVPGMFSESFVGIFQDQSCLHIEWAETYYILGWLSWESGVAIACQLLLQIHLMIWDKLTPPTIIAQSSHQIYVKVTLETHLKIMMGNAKAARIMTVRMISALLDGTGMPAQTSVWETVAASIKDQRGSKIWRW
jgi:hypothetical protein